MEQLCIQISPRLKIVSGAEHPKRHRHRHTDTQTHRHTYIMGIFSSSTPTETTAPNRSKREQCWDARDKYLDCLEKNKIDNPLEDKYAETLKKNCSSESANFDANCAKSWVHYFKEKYVVDLKKERFLKEMEAKGGQQLPFPIKRN